MKYRAFGLALWAVVGLAQAEDTGVGVLGRFGTLGLGLEMGFAATDKWTIRVGANGYNRSETVSESDVDYDAKLNLRNAGMTVDWHPTAGAFRLSGGLHYNGTKLSVLARAKSGNYEINDTQYASTEIGSLSGKMTFSKVAPFLGVGFGNVARKGFAYSVDLGVFYQRSPKVELNVTCGSTTTLRCNQLKSDVQAEQSQLRSDLNSYRFWPVIQAGFGYSF